MARETRISPHISMHQDRIKRRSSPGMVTWLRPGLVGLLLSLATTLPAAAQTAGSSFVHHPDFLVRQWTAQDGLPVAGVTGLHQDENGFLWMTTLAGLLRFDGQQFELFDRSEYPGLPTNRLAFVTPLGVSRLLLTAESGEVLLFNNFAFTNLSERYGFRRYSGWFEYSESEQWLFTDAGVLAIEADGKLRFVLDEVVGAYAGIRSEDGRTWIGSNEGLLVMDDRPPFDRFTVDDGLPSNQVTGLLPTGDGIHVSTPDGIALWKAGQTRDFYHIDAPGEAVNSWRVLEFEEQVLYATERGWRRLSGDVLIPGFSRGTFPTYPPGIYNTSPVVDRKGDFWHAANGNVYRNGTRVLESNGTINQMLADQNGGVWVAHNVLGLFLIQPSAVSTIGAPEGLPGENVYGVTEDAAVRMWIGLLDDRSFVRYDGDRVDARIPMGTPWAAGTDERGRVWLGGSGLCLVQGDACQFINTPGMDPAVRAIYADTKGRLWIGTQSGLWVRSETTSSFTRVRSTAPSDPWIRFIAETASGDLLFGTYGQGLGSIREDSLVFWNEERGFPSNNIRSILPIGSGEIWIGSEDIGLIVLSGDGDLSEGSALTVIGTQQGLPDNSVHAMVQDFDGDVWINSNRGIYRLRPNEVAAFVDGSQDGIYTALLDDRAGMRNREGNGGMQGAGYLDANGDVHFPTQQGVAIVDPDQIVDSAPRNVSVLSALAAGRSLDVSSETVRLSADESVLDIRFSSPQFTSTLPVIYRYRLDGLADEWTSIGTESRLQLNGFPSGRHTLDLQAGLSGYWSDVTSIEFNRTPAFRESIWFILLLVGCGISSGVLFVIGRISIVRRRNEMLEQQVKERTATIESQTRRLAALDELKSHFFSNISHELRTPLTLIKGPVSNLLVHRESASEDELLHQLDVVDRNVDRLASLVNDILDLTALEAGTFELNVQVDDLEALVHRTVALFAEAAANKEIDLQVDTPTGTLFWTYDSARLEHVLVNLVGNALKFTGSGGQIIVSLVPLSPSEIEIVVQDTGRGIPEADLPHVFDRYYQAGNQKDVKGSGIGLSMCRDLVERHGGRIEVKSTVGKGTTFTILLPKRIDAPAANPMTAPSARTSSVAKLVADLEVHESNPDRPTLLVAEDNPDLLEFLGTSLIRHFNVLTASNGREAWELAREAVPDLVITDVMMPEMDGSELCLRLKEGLPTSHIPVVMLTAKGDIESRTEGLRTGADVYLTKPFETRELLAYIRSLLENRQRIQAALTSAPASVKERSANAEGLSAKEDHANLSGIDQAFFNDVKIVVHRSLSNVDLNVEEVAASVNLSARQFHRKMEALTGRSPADFIRSMRLEKATELIEEGMMSLKEIGFAVGFKSESGFRKAFKDQYGVPPSKWKARV